MTLKTIVLDLTKLLALLILGLWSALVWSSWDLPLTGEFIPNLLIYILRVGSMALPLACWAAFASPPLAHGARTKEPRR